MRATCCYNTSSKALIGTGQIMHPQTLSLAVMLPAFISTRKKRGYDGLLGKTCSGQFTTTCSLKDEEKRDKNKGERERERERERKREDLRR